MYFSKNQLQKLNPMKQSKKKLGGEGGVGAILDFLGKMTKNRGTRGAKYL